MESLVGRAWKHSENTSYSHFISPAHGISVVPDKPAQMVHHIWDAALLLHLVQNLLLPLSSRIIKKWIWITHLVCNPCTITQIENFIS